MSSLIIEYTNGNLVEQNVGLQTNIGKSDATTTGVYKKKKKQNVKNRKTSRQPCYCEHFPTNASIRHAEIVFYYESMRLYTTQAPSRFARMCVARARKFAARAIGVSATQYQSLRIQLRNLTDTRESSPKDTRGVSGST